MINFEQTKISNYYIKSNILSPELKEILRGFDQGLDNLNDLNEHLRIILISRKLEK